MGLTHVTLNDEKGMPIREMVANPSVLDPLLASVEQDDSFRCLRYIDPYGDTVFNRLQMDHLLDELHMVIARERFVSMARKYSAGTLSRTSFLSFVSKQSWPELVRRHL
jgi:hypothetical protein